MAGSFEGIVARRRCAHSLSRELPSGAIGSCCADQQAHRRLISGSIVSCFVFHLKKRRKTYINNDDDGDVAYDVVDVTRNQQSASYFGDKPATDAGLIFVLVSCFLQVFFKAP